MVLYMAASCGPSREERAAFMLKQARNSLMLQDTASALLMLDSIPRLHPRALYSVGAAMNLKREILWEIQKRKQVSLDSVEAEIRNLQANFVFSRGEFERSGRYTHSRLLPERNLSRSYLKPEVTEKGDLVLVSQLVGSRINHTRIRVYDGDLECRSDSVPAGSADYYGSSFLGRGWERVTFRNGRENGVIEFIASNGGNNLKTAFLGKGSVVIFLEEGDRKAIGDTYALALLIRQRNQLHQEIGSLQIR
jgi:hypothetical protein